MARLHPRPHSRSLLGTIRAFARDERGAASIEIAFMGPMLLLLLLGLVDVAMGFSMQLQLKQAANRAVEMATVVGPVNGGYGYLSDEAANASGQPSGNVTVSFWLECDDVKQSSSSGTCNTGQQIERYVSLSIVGTYTPIFSQTLLATLLGGAQLGNAVQIIGQSAVRIQ